MLCLIASFLVTGCDMSMPSAHATPSPSNQKGVSSVPGSGSVPGSAAAIPLFDSATALQAMQDWISRVRSGRIADGAATRTPWNSGWIEDVNHPHTFVPYGLFPSHFTFGGTSIEIAVGRVEYVFALRDGASTPATYHYGMLLGTLSSSGQPVSVLVWLSADDGLTVYPTHTPPADDLLLTTSGPNAIHVVLARDANVAMWLTSKHVLHRTVAVNFLTHSEPIIVISGPPPPSFSKPDVENRNSKILALVSHPSAQQSTDGVFARLPSAGFIISYHDGAETPREIVLSEQPGISF